MTAGPPAVAATHSHRIAGRVPIGAKLRRNSELEAWMRQEIDKWVRIVRDANIKGVTS
jgi:hypothetical protein